MPTHIDQGVRLEIETPHQEFWSPIRFYTPSLTPAPPQEGEVSRVVLEEGGRSVHAEAASYNSSLPLVHLNSSVGVAEGVVIREYLCQEYVDMIRNGTRFRLRWMQRYLTNPQADVATWSLDNIRIRLWDGSCFLPLLSEDFNSADITQPDGIRLVIMRGTVTNPQCSDDSVVLFNDGFPGTTEYRRSLLITLLNYTLGSCENACTTSEFT